MHTLTCLKYRENIVKDKKSWCEALCKNYPYSGYILVHISRIRTKYGDLRTKSPKSARIQENAEQKKTLNTDIHVVKLEASMIKQRLLLSLFYQVKTVPRYYKQLIHSAPSF